MDRSHLPIIREFIEMLAKKSSVVAFHAGVGGMETAGSVISYLAANPQDIEPFINGGMSELPSLWHDKGCLTWHAMNGKIVSPEYARRARIIKGMENKDEQ